MSTTFEQAVHNRRRLLGNPYAYVEELEEFSALRSAQRKLENPYAFATELEQQGLTVSTFDSISVAAHVTAAKLVKRSAAEIEAIASHVHAQLWKRRAEIFPDFETRSPVELLDPIVALRLFGYSVEIVGALGQIADSGRGASNVAGLIDKRARQVLLSSGPKPTERKFTAAHELGHALMHEFAGMHRDRPTDGSSTRRDIQEREAEQFAACFLMPGKLLKRIFERTFGEAPFTLDEDRRFALSGSMPNDSWTPRNLRDLSLLLSSSTRFNGVSFTSLADQFGVSVTAMAIRLEQLELVALG